MTIELLFCGMLLWGFVENNTQHLFVIPIELFFSKRFVKIPVVTERF